MDVIFVLMVLATTTYLAYLLTRRLAGSSGRSLRRASEITLECIGACVVFLGLNLALGVALVLLIRGLTPWFVSLYDVSDTILVVLSVLQGFVFQIWWRSSGTT